MQFYHFGAVSLANNFWSYFCESEREIYLFRNFIIWAQNTSRDDISDDYNTWHQTF